MIRGMILQVPNEGPHNLRGFPEIGVSPKSSILDWDFPIFGYPHGYGKPPIYGCPQFLALQTSLKLQGLSVQPTAFFCEVQPTKN